MVSSIVGVLFALVTFIPLVSAHFNQRYPIPYNPTECHLQSNCKGGPCEPSTQCPGPCPLDKSKVPSKPSAVWSRGQEVTIEWHKNNHRGGFYRRSLVPVKHVMDKSWHEKTAFE